MELAPLYYHAGRFGPAEAIYLQLIKTSQNTDTSQYLHSIGLIHEASDNRTLAEASFIAARRLAQKQGNKEVTIACLLSLAKLSIRDGDLKGSVGMVKRALTLSNEIDSKNYKAGALLTFGTLLKERGELLSAMSTFNRSLKIFIDLRDTASVASLLFELGSCSLEIGNLDEALEQFEISKGIYQTLDRPLSTVLTLTQIACTQLQKMNIISAVSTLNEAKTLCEIHSNLTGSLNLSFAEGMLYFNRAEFAPALTKLQQSLKLNVEADDFQQRPHILATMAEFCLWENNLDDAKAHLDEAMLLVDAYNFRASLLELVLRRGRLKLSQGDTQNAKLQFEWVMEESKRQGLPIRREEARLYRSIVYLCSHSANEAARDISKSMSLISAQGPYINRILLYLLSSLLTIKDPAACQAHMVKLAETKAQRNIPEPFFRAFLLKIFAVFVQCTGKNSNIVIRYLDLVDKMGNQDNFDAMVTFLKNQKQ